MKITGILAAALMMGLCVGQAAAAPSQTLHGKVVYYMHAAGARNVVAIAKSNGQGGITFNTYHPMVHTYGNMQSVRPLGLLSNGQLYLIAVPTNHNNVASRLAKDYGRFVAVNGALIQNNGATVLEVYSVH